MTEINGNFNTWDLATSFEQTDHRYQLAVIVSQYAELLRHSPWTTCTSIQQLVNHTYRLSSILWDDTEVVEFASLVSRASQIRALENQFFKTTKKYTIPVNFLRECAVFSGLGSLIPQCPDLAGPADQAGELDHIGIVP